MLIDFIIAAPSIFIKGYNCTHELIGFRTYTVSINANPVVIDKHHEIMTYIGYTEENCFKDKKTPFR